jgi:hypothetical protein
MGLLCWFVGAMGSGTWSQVTDTWVLRRTMKTAGYLTLDLLKALCTECPSPWKAQWKYSGHKSIILPNVGLCVDSVTETTSFQRNTSVRGPWRTSGLHAHLPSHEIVHDTSKCMSVAMFQPWVVVNVTPEGSSVSLATRFQVAWPGCDSRKGLGIFLLATAIRLGYCVFFTRGKTIGSWIWLLTSI